MVGVAVGKDDGGDGLGVEIEGGVDLAGVFALALEEAAVEEDAFPGDLDFVLAAGNGSGGPVEDDLHLGISGERSLQSDLDSERTGEETIPVFVGEAVDIIVVPAGVG